MCSQGAEASGHSDEGTVGEERVSIRAFGQLNRLFQKDVNVLELNVPINMSSRR